MKNYIILILIFNVFCSYGQDTLKINATTMSLCKKNALLLFEKENLCIGYQEENIIFCNNTTSFKNFWHIEGNTNFGFLGVQTSDNKNYIIFLNNGKAKEITSNIGKEVLSGLRKKCTNGKIILVFKTHFKEMLMEGISYEILVINVNQKSYEHYKIDERVENLDITANEIVVNNTNITFKFSENDLIITECK